MDSINGSVALPQSAAESVVSGTSYNKSTRAMILELQAIMKKLYNTYVECQAELEQNSVELQAIAFKKANDAKDKRKEADQLSGWIGMGASALGFAITGGFGVAGWRNPQATFASGIDMGSHLSSPASGIANNFAQAMSAGVRSEAEEHQIRADLARNVVDSAQRDAGKVRDTADQHHDQYLREAGQLTQDMIAAFKAAIAPR